ncbi:uncharacterized protein MONOS_7236 [Monocercomonoides exilis]|uniref:uncharacterized protein n=1 Tax=Monocercomonoides exilis TaxID=2049356 RepID=UPI003559F62C|nr:hypothetical protein MONOS_7236 [Monocercomonoides exilis]|eukprot:MONOS_7236.1-p1 / transcript=MONOS_7236.1 / gene=MONOS_7236 / organism=Monocercomonoides_exilis_PA203 / gene_product=unspecified product / transcript_product=unspecified product / location=Mono_scaffold00242:61468-64751(+) / protein_length=932 / sequence_SO=supercontig / SO=protein_coding / is_pseudo=false
MTSEVDCGQTLSLPGYSTFDLLANLAYEAKKLFSLQLTENKLLKQDSDVLTREIAELKKNHKNEVQLLKDTIRTLNYEIKQLKTQLQVMQSSQTNSSETKTNVNSESCQSSETELSATSTSSISENNTLSSGIGTLITEPAVPRPPSTSLSLPSFPHEDTQRTAISDPIGMPSFVKLPQTISAPSSKLSLFPSHRSFYSDRYLSSSASMHLPSLSEPAFVMSHHLDAVQDVSFHPSILLLMLSSRDGSSTILDIARTTRLHKKKRKCKYKENAKEKEGEIERDLEKDKDKDKEKEKEKERDERHLQPIAYLVSSPFTSSLANLSSHQSNSPDTKLQSSSSFAFETACATPSSFSIDSVTRSHSTATLERKSSSFLNAGADVSSSSIVRSKLNRRRRNGVFSGIFLPSLMSPGDEERMGERADRFEDEQTAASPSAASTSSASSFLSSSFLTHRSPLSSPPHFNQQAGHSNQAEMSASVLSLGASTASINSVDSFKSSSSSLNASAGGAGCSSSYNASSSPKKSLGCIAQGFADGTIRISSLPDPHYRLFGTHGSLCPLRLLDLKGHTDTVYSLQEEKDPACSGSSVTSAPSSSSSSSLSSSSSASAAAQGNVGAAVEMRKSILLLSASADDTVKLWRICNSDFEDGSQAKVSDVLPCKTQSAPSHRSGQIFSFTRGRTADRCNSELLDTPVTALFHPIVKTSVVAGYKSGDVALYDISVGMQLGAISTAQNPSTTIAKFPHRITSITGITSFSNSCPLIVSALNGSIHLLDTRTHSVVNTIANAHFEWPANPPASASASPAAVNAPTPPSAHSPTPFSSLSFSGFTSVGSISSVSSVASPPCIPSLHPCAVTSTAYCTHHLDATCFVSGGSDCSIRLWDLRSLNEPLAIFPKHHRQMFDEGITKVMFHPQKPLLVSAGADGVVNLYVRNQYG